MLSAKSGNQQSQSNWFSWTLFQSVGSSQFAPVYREARKSLLVPCCDKSERENFKKKVETSNISIRPKAKSKLLHNCKKGKWTISEFPSKGIVNLAKKKKAHFALFHFTTEADTPHYAIFFLKMWSFSQPFLSYSLEISWNNSAMEAQCVFGGLPLHKEARSTVMKRFFCHLNPTISHYQPASNSKPSLLIFSLSLSLLHN